MSSPTRAATETSFLLPAPANLETLALDPRVLARARELVAAQLQAAQPAVQAAPLQNVTVQREIPFNGGTYVGDILDGEPHGRGTITYPPGHERRGYEGEWKNGKFHGKGALRFTNGTIFEGEWQYGSMHGRGIMIWGDGSRYEGQLVAGDNHGTGSMRWANGDTYEGEWVCNKKHGKGIFRAANGETYNGHYYDDQACGEGKRTYSDGGWYEGGWAKGKYNGKGYFYSRQREHCEEGEFRGGDLWNGKSWGTSRNGIGGVSTVKDGVIDNSCCCNIL